ncbi:hypothetical protein [Halorubrum sodomense]|uniref:Uncharacterized protein n=1 Tax=Halorubrum sodomense TaxID=35743 RepID=A0A1I6FLN7_HALSD|nr:hypothetical protein [Halorubrum sodomense]SFR30764.1 hypothetical protein SAMN04487937_0594 [Halorubrum sodomense]
MIEFERAARLLYVICALDGSPFVWSRRWRGDAAGFEQEAVSVDSGEADGRDRREAQGTRDR